MKVTILAAALGALALAAPACKKDEKKSSDQKGSDKKGKDKDKGTPPTKRSDENKPGGSDKPIDPKQSKAAGSLPILIDPGAEQPVPVERAVVVLAPTKGSKVTATIVFERADKGLKLKVAAQGLPPGKHAYHVHLLGDCSSDDGNSAGTHFNFDGSSKKPATDHPHITGDLGDLEAGKDGKATAEATIEKGSLQGPFSILGRSVIIHEKPNDPKNPPMGAAGGRLACGVIGISEPPAQAPTK
jgi:Cu-Zn family superoxide dismutase